MPAARRRCKDCDGGNRPAPYAGPRCKTHWRAELKRRREAAWARWIWTTYRLTAEAYYKILALQGGTCALCRRARGLRRKLAVDHDHACCPSTPTCGLCTRGLCCATCNKLLGHLRDDPAAFERGKDYLTNPPAREVLGWNRQSESS